MILLYLSEALRIYKRSPLAAFVVIIITTLSVLLAVSSYIVISLSIYYSDRIKSNIEITAYIDEVVDSIGVHHIESSLLKNTNVKSVKFISKQEALESFIKETGEDFRTVLDHNPLPRSLSIRLKPELVDNKSFPRIISNLRNINGISELVYDYEFISKILGYIKSGQYVLYIGTLLLLILSIYLIYTNSRIQYESNKELYQTMKLVGAKLSALKIPIIIYGISIGMISCIISLILVIWSFYLLLHTMGRNFYEFLTISELTYIICGVGIFIGFIGSFFTAQKINLNIIYDSE